MKNEGFSLVDTNIDHVPVRYLAYAWEDIAGHSRRIEIMVQRDLWMQGASLIQMGKVLQAAAEAEQEVKAKLKA